ncbi:MAG: Crp/Fnr family transcriptional regulator [Bdellovibrionales bacterium]|nr:Crp/Fnr family transcriptional regulator [Bdellovibrionales bacterium]
MTKKDCNPQPDDCIHCESRHLNPLCSLDEVVSAISQVRTMVSFKTDQYIFYSGNSPVGIYTIESGLVKLEVNSPKGSAHTLRLMGPGSILGYRSLFANEPYQASAIAVEDSQLCFIPKSDILKIATTQPQAALNLMSYLAKDLRLAEEKWMYQIDKEAPERVAEALLFLMDHFQDQEWTRREIAEWAGTTPETVMRTLGQFEKSGWIQQDGRRIQIINKNKIKEKAQV